LLWSRSCYTLFPYTTLFRSRTDLIRELDESDVYSFALAAITIGNATRRQLVGRSARHREINELRARHVLKSSRAEAGFLNMNPTDRKSTRLNSSHLVISYAV